MIKYRIGKYFISRRVKLVLLLFVVSLLALSLTALPQHESSSLTSMESEKNESTSVKTDREEESLGNRGFIYDRRHVENNENDMAAERVKGSVVVVDAGHGGVDSGTGYEELEEKNINLDIALKLGEMLKKSGINVIYTREKDEYIGLNKRADIANDAGASLFVSIHCNSMEDDAVCNGSETLYKNKKTETGKVNSEKLAEIIQGELTGSLGMKDNGIKYRPRLAVLALTKMPAVIAEIGYISNYSDREKLVSEEYRIKAADALCKGIIEALSEIKQ